MKPQTTLFLAVILCMTVSLANALTLDVAVLDLSKAEGQCIGERAVFDLFAAHPDLNPRWITDLQPDTLAGFSAVVLPDVHSTGNLAEGWAQTLRAYVEAGGGLVITHDSRGLPPHELFPEIEAVAGRHIGQRISSFTNHALTFGLGAFDAAFGDHWDMQPGPAGEAVATCAQDKPVVVVGQLGQGRVVRVGLCVGITGSGEQQVPEGMEARLMLNSVAWAAGTSPWHLTDYGDVTVALEAQDEAVAQPEPVHVAVTVSIRAAEIAMPVRIVLRDEAGAQVSDASVVVEGRKQPGRGVYLRTQAQVELPTADLPDGRYTLSAEGEQVSAPQIAVNLRGQLMAEDRERTLRAREVLQNTVSKFVFNQGYEFNRDISLLDPYMAKIKETGFNTYDYSGGDIWREESFEMLEKVLDSAQRHGLMVWATFNPPSGSREIAEWELEKRQNYYYETIERFAHLSLRYPNFVAFTCDDFDYNYGFFTTEMMAEMARRWRSINPDLYFLPLIYYGGITEEFMRTRGPYLDGVVFHFRANSYPPSYIDNYDPKDFDMYGDVQRYEFKRIRHIVGDKLLISGVYIWYYEKGWGVLTPDEQNPSVEHIVRDAAQKFEISHDYAIGTRIYGLGIDHPAYEAMGDLQKQWEHEGSDWGRADISDPEKEVRKYRVALDNPPYFATLLQRPSELSEQLLRQLDVPQIDLHWRMMEDAFDPHEAVNRFFASRSPAPS